MATNKLIRDWQKIFLDTSIIISLFTSEKPDVTDESILFTKKLIRYLSDNNSAEGKNRVFLISSITVCELLTKENDTTKIRRIIEVLNSNNVEFIDFDLHTSLLFNSKLYPHLSKDKLNQRAAQLGFQSHDFMMAREWIHRDYMIIMSAAKNNADVILTHDRKTFYPLTVDSDCFCSLVNPSLFEHTDSHILKYHNNKVEEFIQNNGQLI